MHIINRNKIYMTLCKSVAESIDVTKLQDCEVFISTQQFCNRVKELHGLDTDKEVSGTELEVWDDGLIENYHLEAQLDITNIEEGISNLHMRHLQ